MAGLRWFERNPRKLSKRLRARLAEDPGGRVPVLIMYRDRGKEEVRRRVRDLGGRIARDLPIIGAFAAELPEHALAELNRRPEVRQLHLDREVYPRLDIALPSIGGHLVRGSGLTGRGVTIAFLDSGIHPHRDFTRPRNRIVGWRDLVNDRRSPYDDNGHGTHVAGIAAGSGRASGGRYRGVAPEASIVAVKVADEEGSAPMSRLIEGLQWVMDHRQEYGIRVVNLSLGADPSESYRHDPLCRAVETLWRAGLVVVAAAGNDGPAPGSIDTPGNDPLIITVGAMDDVRTTAREDDDLPEFSSRGPTNDGLRKPDLLAPGVAIVAPAPDGGYASRTGTSMATPFVSGAAALLLERDARLRPEQVKSLLRRSAQKLDLPVNAAGAGYLDLGRLLGLPEGEGEAAPEPAAGAGDKNAALMGLARQAARNLVREELFLTAGRMLLAPLVLLLLAALI
ncbi:MAG: S8 family peptidase [Bacteroidota bacterium]